MQDYGSFISLKAVYISNTLIDLYIPWYTLAAVVLVVLGYRALRKAK